MSPRAAAPPPASAHPHQAYQAQVEVGSTSPLVAGSRVGYGWRPASPAIQSQPPTRLSTPLPCSLRPGWGTHGQSLQGHGWSPPRTGASSHPPTLPQ